MIQILAVGFGGILGALTRYYLGKYIALKSNFDFPWGTFFINITGAYILSFFAFNNIMQTSSYVEMIKLFVMTGFLGAYTTFSTFSYETYQLIKARDYFNVIFYVLGTLVFGLLAAYAGMLSSKWV